MPRRQIGSLLIVVALLWALALPASAQFGEGPSFDLQGEFGGLGGDFGGLDAPSGEPLQVNSFIVPAAGGEPALLVVRAKMATGWHVYSLTQKPGGPPATKIAIGESDKYSFIEGFRAKEKPEVSVKPEAWPDLPVEEHYGQVTWIAPIRFADGVDPSSIEIEGELVDGQVCHDKEGCRQFGFALTPKFTATLATDEQIASVRP